MHVLPRVRVQVVQVRQRVHLARRLHGAAALPCPLVDAHWAEVRPVLLDIIAHLDLCVPHIDFVFASRRIISLALALHKAVAVVRLELEGHVDGVFTLLELKVLALHYVLRAAHVQLVCFQLVLLRVSLIETLDALPHGRF